MRALKATGLAVLLALGAGVAMAQDPVASYPNRPIRIVVPFPPGGPTDITTRLVAAKLQEAFGVGVVAENRPGAGGNIGQDLVAKAPPDGYSLVLSSFGPMVIAPVVYSKLNYDPDKDLTPITLAAINWFFIAAHPSVPVASLKELVALAKSKPGTLTYGTSGNATPAHLGGALFSKVAGVELLHVPYKGASESIGALSRAEVLLAFESPPLIVPLAREGKLKVLAAARKDKSPLLPEAPTVAEAGFPGAEVGSWYGFHAPAGTPKPIIEKLHAEMTKALRAPDVKERLLAIGAEATTTSPEEFTAFILSERAKWTEIVKATGAKVD